MNLRKIAVSCIATAFLLSNICVNEASAKHEIVMSTSTYSTHSSVQKAYFPVFKWIEEQTNGEVTMTYFEPGTLVPDKEYFQGVSDGILDITYLFPSVLANQFPLLSIADYPLLFTSSEQASLALTKVLQTNKQIAKEIADVKFLWSGFSVPQDFLTTKEIRTLEDLKGLRIGVRSLATVNIVKLLGAVPIIIPMTDMYVSLERGMIDGVLMPFPQYRATKVAEAAKYLTRCSIVSSGAYYIINKEKYNSLPQKAKDIFDNMQVATTVLESSWLDTMARSDLVEMQKELGIKVYDLPSTEKARWAEKINPMYDDWKKSVNAKGINADAILADVLKWRDFYANPANINAARQEAMKFYPKDMFPN